MFGVLSKNPWIMGANSLATICVNNAQVERELINGGVNENNIKITGSYKYSSPKNINPKNKISNIGFALPQLFEHNILPWKEHIESIENLLGLMAKLSVNIIIYLHPKMDIKNYEYLEHKYQCVIGCGRTDDNIPLLDIYVATFSTTVFTSLVYGIPALVLDSFDANYNMFDDYKSVNVFKSEETLALYLESLIKDNESYMALVSDVAKDALSIEPFLGCGMNNLAKVLAVEV